MAVAGSTKALGKNVIANIGPGGKYPGRSLASSYKRYQSASKTSRLTSQSAEIMTQ